MPYLQKGCFGGPLVYQNGHFYANYIPLHSINYVQYITPRIIDICPKKYLKKKQLVSQYNPTNASQRQKNKQKEIPRFKDQPLSFLDRLQITIRRKKQTEENTSLQGSTPLLSCPLGMAITRKKKRQTSTLPNCLIIMPHFLHFLTSTAVLAISSGTPTCNS